MCRFGVVMGYTSILASDDVEINRSIFGLFGYFDLFYEMGDGKLC